MTLKDPALWTRIETDPIRLSSGETLEDRVLAESGLGRDRARQVVLDYRRFLYLAATSGEIVAPSPIIDRVWHKHLEDTRAYFDNFCPRIFGRVLHHTPGRAIAALDPAYQRTLALFDGAFGPPNARIWPSPAAQMRDAVAGKLLLGGTAVFLLLTLYGWFTLAAALAVAALGVFVWREYNGPWFWIGIGTGGGCGVSCGGGDGDSGCDGDSGGDGGCGGGGD